MQQLESSSSLAPPKAPRKRRGRWAAQAAQSSTEDAERREQALGLLGLAAVLLWGAVCWCGRAGLKAAKVLRNLSELSS